MTLRQQYDRIKAAADAAYAHEEEARDAYTKAVQGTPPEELNQARHEYEAAAAALALLTNGSRKEDIEAARKHRDAAREALRLELAGTRREDIEAADAKLRQAQATLDELVAGNRPQEKTEAKAAADGASAALQSAKVNFDEHTIRSARDGVIDRVLVAEGDVVTAGAPVARIDDPGDIWVRVYVPEILLSNVGVGTPALLKVDGIDTPLLAHVDRVASQGEFTPANLQTPDERGKQVFEVRLRLNKFDTRVKAGMYATVRSLVSHQ